MKSKSGNKKKSIFSYNKGGIVGISEKGFYKYPNADAMIVPVSDNKNDVITTKGMKNDLILAYVPATKENPLTGRICESCPDKLEYVYASKNKLFPVNAKHGMVVEVPVKEDVKKADFGISTAMAVGAQLYNVFQDIKARREKEKELKALSKLIDLQSSIPSAVKESVVNELPALNPLQQQDMFSGTNYLAKKGRVAPINIKYAQSGDVSDLESQNTPQSLYNYSNFGSYLTSALGGNPGIGGPYTALSGIAAHALGYIKDSSGQYLKDTKLGRGIGIGMGALGTLADTVLNNRLKRKEDEVRTKLNILSKKPLYTQTIEYAEDGTSQPLKKVTDSVQMYKIGGNYHKDGGTVLPLDTEPNTIVAEKDEMLKIEPDRAIVYGNKKVPAKAIKEIKQVIPDLKGIDNKKGIKFKELAEEISKYIYSVEKKKQEAEKNYNNSRFKESKNSSHLAINHYDEKINNANSVLSALEVLQNPEYYAGVRVGQNPDIRAAQNQESYAGIRVGQNPDIRAYAGIRVGKNPDIRFAQKGTTTKITKRIPLDFISRSDVPEYLEKGFVLNEDQTKVYKIDEEVKREKTYPNIKGTPEFDKWFGEQIKKGLEGTEQVYTDPKTGKSRRVKIELAKPSYKEIITETIQEAPIMDINIDTSLLTKQVIPEKMPLPSKETKPEEEDNITQSESEKMGLPFIFPNLTGVYNPPFQGTGEAYFLGTSPQLPQIPNPQFIPLTHVEVQQNPYPILSAKKTEERFARSVGGFSQNLPQYLQALAEENKRVQDFNLAQRSGTLAQNVQSLNQYAQNLANLRANQSSASAQILNQERMLRSQAISSIGAKEAAAERERRTFQLLSQVYPYGYLSSNLQTISYPSSFYYGIYPDLKEGNEEIGITTDQSGSSYSVSKSGIRFGGNQSQRKTKVSRKSKK